MNCKGVIRELSNYIDGDLDPALKVELERHLEHCEDCTMIVDQTNGLVLSLTALNDGSISGDFLGTINDLLQIIVTDPTCDDVS